MATKKRIIVVLGTRPEAIKLFPVVLQFRRHPSVQCDVWSTGQHREMLTSAFKSFNLQPDLNLKLMRAGQGPGQFVAEAIRSLDRQLGRTAPDLVLAQGDTGTVLAAALASFYRRIPFGHIEAGLRTGDLAAPWPEEANRVLVTRISRLHFAPTSDSQQNLLREGVVKNHVWVTGNTVVDALKYILARRIPVSPEAMPFLHKSARPFILITAHRRESQGQQLKNVLGAVLDISKRLPHVDLVFPVHLNPVVQRSVKQVLLHRPQNIHLLRPLDYATFVRLMDRCALILTDSGGIQEEAPSLGKRVLVLRKHTERPEALRTGLLTLVGTNRSRITSETCSAMAKAASNTSRKNPYGDGRASERIVRACLRFLRTSPS